MGGKRSRRKNPGNTDNKGDKHTSPERSKDVCATMTAVHRGRNADNPKNM